MNAERLLALYDRVADAPDAVGRLRRFVLDLAVRGRLVVQDPADESASELSESIARSRMRNSDLPRNWCYVAVGDILEFKYGKGLKASDREEHGPVPVYGSNGIVGYTVEPLTARPSVIVGRKGSAGALNKCDGPSWTTDVAYYVEAPGFFDLDFLFLSLATLDLTELAKGVKPGLSRADAYTKLIRVPPLGEQGRIVAKADELMTLCDRLNEAQTAREGTCDRLTKASLARLTASDTDEPTFRGHARFAIHALPVLTARADQIKHLRQTILSLAVRGRLVEQDPADEPASELLKRIMDKREILLKAKRIKSVEVNPIGLGQTPFDIPRTWQWIRLGNVGDWGSGSTPLRANKEFFGGDVTWLKSGELNDDRHLVGSDETITQQALDNCSFRMNRPGDVLIAMYGATIGKLAILAESAVTNQAVCGCTPFQGVFNRFLFLFLLSQRGAFQRSSEGGAQPNISKVKIIATPFPLPPLAEQHRIVARADELMALCDRLEDDLGAAVDTRKRLLESLLQDTLTPSTHEAATADARAVTV